MPTKIFPHAQKRLVEVWLYTEENWGVDQADRYIYGLHAAFEKTAALTGRMEARCVRRI